MNKNVPGEINDLVWRLLLQSAAVPGLWWCQSKTPHKSLRNHKRDPSQKRKSHFSELTGSSHNRGHSPCTTMRDVWGFFFSFSDWKTNTKKIVITGETRLFPLPVSLLEDDGMQEGIGGAQVERKRQSVTSQVARRKISQTNGAKEFTARTGSVLAKWDAGKGCHSRAFVFYHMTGGNVAPEIKTKSVFFLLININCVQIFSFFFLIHHKETSACTTSRLCLNSEHLPKSHKVTKWLLFLSLFWSWLDMQDDVAPCTVEIMATL